MPTIIERIIASSSGDYTTLSAWESGEQRNLVTMASASCSNFSSTPFTLGETLYFVGSSATGSLVSSGSVGIRFYTSSAAPPVVTDVIQGSASLASCSLDSIVYSDGEIAYAQISGSWSSDDTTETVINGWTTDATRYINIYATGSARHAGVWSSGSNAAYRLITTNPAAASISIPNNPRIYTFIYGVQLGLRSNSSSTRSCISLTAASGSYIVIDGCIARQISTSGVGARNGFYSSIGGAAGTLSDIIVRNCIAYGFSGSGFRTDASSTKYLGFHNNTAANCNFGYYNELGGNYAEIINNIAHNIATHSFWPTSSTGAGSSWSASSDYNISSTGSQFAPGAHSISGSSPVFVNAYLNDYRLDPIHDTVAYQRGKNLYETASRGFTFQTDINNSTRPTSGAWDIGADQAPTVITKTVKSADGDYTTLSAWEAGRQSNLIVSDSIEQAECHPFTDTTAVTVDTWQTDASRFIRVYSSGSMTGVWNPSGYILNRDGVSLITNVFAARYEGLQFNCSSAFDGFSRNTITFGGDYNTGPSDIRFNRCIVRHTGLAYGDMNGLVTTATGLTQRITITNCLFYDFWSGSAITNNANPMIVYNTTIANSRTAIFSGFEGGYGAQCLVKNTLYYEQNVSGALGFVSSSVAFHASSSNNASSNGSAPGVNSRTNQTFVFLDAANDNYQITSNDAGAKGYGTDLSNDSYYPISTDIAGETRTSPWDIGAFKYVTQVVSSALKFVMKTVGNLVIRGRNASGKAKGS